MRCWFAIQITWYNLNTVSYNNLLFPSGQAQTQLLLLSISRKHLLSKVLKILNDAGLWLSVGVRGKVQKEVRRNIYKKNTSGLTSLWDLHVRIRARKIQKSLSSCKGSSLRSFSSPCSCVFTQGRDAVHTVESHWLPRQISLTVTQFVSNFPWDQKWI